LNSITLHHLEQPRAGDRLVDAVVVVARQHDGEVELAARAVVVGHVQVLERQQHVAPVASIVPSPPRTPPDERTNDSHERFTDGRTDDRTNEQSKQANECRRNANGDGGILRHFCFNSSSKASPALFSLDGHRPRQPRERE